MGEPAVICLTPVRNESWILDRFLRCASLWADHIIIADQGSTDNSREIANRYPKVILVDNPSREFNEADRQRLLLESARTISGLRLLITLDADEILTAEVLRSEEWKKILDVAPGTVLQFRLLNIRPNMKEYWSPDIVFPWGFMDDGASHTGAEIHSFRVPVLPGSAAVTLQDVKVLHYQYTDWNRMRSKHRWYQCWERVHQPARHAIDIYRRYHHMDAVPQREIHTLLSEWFSGYEHRGIDMTSVTKNESYWWDDEVLSFIEKHGTRRFRREAIWDIDWVTLAGTNGRHGRRSLFADPRTGPERLIHRWLERTQSMSGRFYVRFVDTILKQMGW